MSIGISAEKVIEQQAIVLEIGTRVGVRLYTHFSRDYVLYLGSVVKQLEATPKQAPQTDTFNRGPGYFLATEVQTQFLADITPAGEERYNAVAMHPTTLLFYPTSALVKFVCPITGAIPQPRTAT